MFCIDVFVLCQRLVCLLCNCFVFWIFLSVFFLLLFICVYRWDKSQIEIRQQPKKGIERTTSKQGQQLSQGQHPNKGSSKDNLKHGQQLPQRQQPNQGQQHGYLKKETTIITGTTTIMNGTTILIQMSFARAHAKGLTKIMFYSEPAFMLIQKYS